MDEVTRLLVLLGLAGVAITVVAGIVRWRMNEVRRIRRGLKIILKGDTHGFLAALGRGRGIGFNFTSNQVAVTWDTGAWGLIYSLDELMGAEVIVDAQVVGRVHRGEPRRALDAFDAQERVALRLVFDDPGSPDFTLNLWLPEDEGRRDELPPGEAIAEANRWLARIEALLRRPITTKRPSQAAAAAPTPAATPAQPEAAPIIAGPPPGEPPPFRLHAEDDDRDQDDAVAEDEVDDEDDGDAAIGRAR